MEFMVTPPLTTGAAPYRKMWTVHNEIPLSGMLAIPQGVDQQDVFTTEGQGKVHRALFRLCPL
jgi:hypothetical protein